MLTADFAELIDTSKAVVMRWQKEGLGPSFQRTRCCNRPLYRPEDVQDWLAEHAANAEEYGLQSQAVSKNALWEADPNCHSCCGRPIKWTHAVDCKNRSKHLRSAKDRRRLADRRDDD